MTKSLLYMARAFISFSPVLMASLSVQSNPTTGSVRESLSESADAIVTIRPTGKPSTAVKAKGDSIESIKFDLQREFKSERQVFRVKKDNLADSIFGKAHTLTVPQILTLVQDSSRTEEFRTQDEFRDYWTKVEIANGISAMKSRYDARDPDRSRIPKIYLADSSVVLLPGWIVLRKRK